MSRTSTITPTAETAATGSNPDRLLTDRDVAAILQMDDGTLRNWRAQRRGPKFLRLGTRVRYRLADVHAWLNARTVVTTAR